MVGILCNCEVEIQSFIFNESYKYEDEINWYKIYDIDVFNLDELGYYMQDYKFVL